MSEKLAAINHVTSKMDARQRAALCWQEMSMGNIAVPANADAAVKFMTPHFERAMADAKEREKLPGTREGIVHHFTIIAKNTYGDGVEEHKGYIQTGVYEEDGRLGEIFLKLGKSGDVSAWLDQFATCFSIALQYGAPFDVLARKFVSTRFEPAGATKNIEVPRCTSLVDYVAKYLLLRYGNPESKAFVAAMAHTEVQP